MRELIMHPDRAFKKGNPYLSYILVILTVVTIVFIDALLGHLNDNGVPSAGRMLLTTIYGIMSYVAVSAAMWLLCYCFGCRCSILEYVQNWGLTFIPNLIVALLVAWSENYYLVFYCGEWVGVLFFMLFVTCFLWKIILYAIFINEKGGLKGSKLAGAFILGAIIVAVLAYINVNVGLKTPVL